MGAQAALIWAQLLVRRRRRGDLVRRSEGRAAIEASAQVEPEVQRIARAVSRASRYGVIRPTCLVRAIALRRLLALRGYPSAQVRVGVRRDAQGLVAHAWVVYQGIVVGEDRGDLAELVELPEAEIPL